MKLCVISPMNRLNLMRGGDWFFALADMVLKHKAYKAFLRSREPEEFCIMDNGAFELGTPMSNDGILNVAKLIKADEVIAPDYPFDTEKTYSKTEEFIETTNVSKKYRVMAVPQGRTLEQYKKSWMWFTALDEVDTLGVSILFDKKIYPRVKLFNHLMDRFPTDKDIHFLGLDDMLELGCIRDSSWVRSVDCSMPITHAAHGIVLNCLEKHKLKRVNLEYADPDIGLCQDNIYTLRCYVNSV